MQVTPAMAVTIRGHDRPSTEADVNERTCAVEECEKPRYCRGWCTRHYQRWKANGDPTQAQNLSGCSTLDRLFHNSDRSGGPHACWLWRGEVGATGYARLSGRHLYSNYAHRLMYFELFGEIPPGLEIDHACHDPRVCPHRDACCPHRRCVNPAHLEVVTPSVNVQRSGRWNQFLGHLPSETS